MHIVLRPLLLGLALVVSGCSPPPAAAPGAAPDGDTPSAAPATFINRVWRAVEANGAPRDQLYVFLSSGALVVASATGKPMVGRWAHAGEGLSMVEEGQEHTTDILALTADEFRIRSHNPGQPVDIRLVPADRDNAAPAR